MMNKIKSKLVQKFKNNSSSGSSSSSSSDEDLNQYPNESEQVEHRFQAPGYNGIDGFHGTLVPFYFTNNIQEALTGNSTLHDRSYHSKIYTIDSNLTMTLPPGRQRGQLKCVTFVHSGKLETSIKLISYAWSSTSHILFTNVGDQVQLIWTGGVWTVVSSLNTIRPSLNTPKVNM